MSEPTDILGKLGQKVGQTIKAHTDTKTNPHNVTKTQVGLGNVENVALSSWTGTTKIAKVGTLTDGSIPWSLINGGPDLASSTGVDGDFTIAGNLTVNGDTTTVNTQTVVVEDNVIEVNLKSDGAETAQTGGIQVNRGATSATGAVGSIALSGGMLPESLTFVQIGSTVNGQPAYRNEAGASTPANEYQIEFITSMSPEGEWANGNTYDGWRVTKSDGYGNYADFHQTDGSNPGETITDTVFIIHITDTGTDLSQKLEDWFAISEYSSSYGNGNLGSISEDAVLSVGDSETDYTIYTDADGEWGITATLNGLTTQATPFVSASANDKAQIIWDDNQNKFILKLGSNKADLVVNKLYSRNVFPALSDLPSASTYHGMVAHVHETGQLYLAHAGSWLELVSVSGGQTINGNISATVFKAPDKDGFTINGTSLGDYSTFETALTNALA